MGRTARWTILDNITKQNASQDDRNTRARGFPRLRVFRLNKQPPTLFGLAGLRAVERNRVPYLFYDEVVKLPSRYFGFFANSCDLV